MTFKFFRIAYLVLWMAITGCAALPSLALPSQPTPATTAQASVTPQPFPSNTPTATSNPQARILRVWLPPRFNPEADTSAAFLLKRRLIEFEADHPGVKIEVRIKAETGDASLLNALAITSVAAPSALPDLIALPRPDLESAVDRGLLHPMDGLSTLLDDPNWYPYARELGHVKNIGYGLPFAGDALVLIRRPDAEARSWDAIFSNKTELAFAAGDTQALTALALYLSAGGRLLNDQGQPTLEEGPLLQTLLLIRSGLEAQTFSPTLVDLKTDEDVFQTYRDGRSRMVIVWAAGKNLPFETIPPVTNPQTLANGWVWALAGSTPEKQQVATALAEFLMEDPFLTEWQDKAGFLPTRISSTGSQPDAAAVTILKSAQALPSNETLSALGDVMAQAVAQVLGGESVDSVVRSVLEQVK